MESWASLLADFLGIFILSCRLASEWRSKLSSLSIGPLEEILLLLPRPGPTGPRGFSFGANQAQEAVVCTFNAILLELYGKLIAGRFFWGGC